MTDKTELPGTRPSRVNRRALLKTTGTAALLAAMKTSLPAPSRRRGGLT